MLFRSFGVSFFDAFRDISQICFFIIKPVENGFFGCYYSSTKENNCCFNYP